MRIEPNRKVNPNGWRADLIAMLFVVVVMYAVGMGVFWMITRGGR